MGYNLLMIRLNKYLASVGVASRRGVDRLVENGKVTINGKLAVLGEKVTGNEEIKVDGVLVGGVEKKEYWAVYKPQGIVSTASDEMGRKNVTELIQSKARLYPVGRLDKDSEGLMLLTNDGELALRLTHPKYHLEIEYEVETDRRIDPKNLRPGINKIVKIIGNKMTIIMYEGKKRQIRNMCWEAGVRVKKLVRVRIGKLKLGNLRPGEVIKIKKDDF
jgi:23S rRNA pseudouridine2605 synthase